MVSNNRNLSHKSLKDGALQKEDGISQKLPVPQYCKVEQKCLEVRWLASQRMEGSSSINKKPSLQQM